MVRARQPAFTLAAVALGGGEFELEQIELPRPDDVSGLLRVEATGVCGSDVKKYERVTLAPTILGHEIVGVIDKAGAVAARQWGVGEGSRVLLEEYLPCGHCRACRSGQFRGCSTTDVTQSGAVRYGSTPVAMPPALWGGYSRHMYLHLNSVMHVVPDSVSSEHATFAIPLSNGVQWALHEGGVRGGDVVVIEGPGQQGLGCVIASKAAGAGRIIVTGLARDASRLELAKVLGADRVVNIDRESVHDVVDELANGQGADVVIDVSGAGGPALQTALGLVRRRGTVVLASGGRGAPPTIDIEPIRKKEVRILGARGHSFDAVERALGMLASGAIPLARLCEPSFALEDVKRALEFVQGAHGSASVHATVSPWSSEATPSVGRLA